MDSINQFAGNFLIGFALTVGIGIIIVFTAALIIFIAETVCGHKN